MVCVQNKLLQWQVMSPMLQRLHNNIKFQIISWMLILRFVQLLAEVRYQPSFLTQYPVPIASTFASQSTWFDNTKTNDLVIFNN